MLLCSITRQQVIVKLIVFSLKHIHGVMTKAMYQLSVSLSKLLPMDGDGMKEIRTGLVDGISLLGQAMIKTTHYRVITN